MNIILLIVIVIYEALEMQNKNALGVSHGKLIHLWSEETAL